MKCPKSKEFFCFTLKSIHCEQNFDSKMHSADTVGVWRIILIMRLVLNYVMISSLHLLHMVSTHHSTPMQQPCKHLYDSIADKW